MAHHHGELTRDYFTEQLLTMLVCGLFGFAAVQMYRTEMLGFLAEQFRAPVLYGGIAVLVLVAIRAVAVWKEAGEMQAHAHHHNHDHHHAHGDAAAAEHVHGPDCDHEHVESHTHDHDHSHQDHGHGHDMSWVFARMLILVFPVALFFLGIPNSTFSKEYQLKLAGNDAALGGNTLKELAQDAATLEEKPLPDGSVVRILQTSSGLKIRATTPAGGGEPKLELIAGVGTRMRFNDLNDAAFDQKKRESLEGQTAILEGRFKRLADKEFSLFRLKMTCCATDSVPLKVRIIVPQALNGFSDFDWVQLKGQVQFLKDPRQDRYIPVIMVADVQDVRKGEAKNEYE